MHSDYRRNTTLLKEEYLYISHNALCVLSDEPGHLCASLECSHRLWNAYRNIRNSNSFPFSYWNMRCESNCLQKSVVRLPKCVEMTFGTSNSSMMCALSNRQTPHYGICQTFKYRVGILDFGRISEFIVIIVWLKWMWIVDTATIASELMISLNAKSVNSMSMWNACVGPVLRAISLGK